MSEIENGSPIEIRPELDTSTPGETPASIASRVSEIQLPFAALALVFVSTALTAIATFGAPFELSGDSGMLLSTGRSLFERGAFEYNFRPETRFPPLYPFISAAAIAVSDQHFLELLRSLGIFSLLAGHIAAFYLLRKLLPVTAVCAVIILSLSTPQLLEYAVKDALTDIPYCALSAFTVLLAERAQRRRLAPISTAALCILTSAVVLLRSIGIALPAALLFFLCWRKLAGRSVKLSATLLPGIAGGLSYLAWNIWKKKHLVPYYDGEYMLDYEKQIWLRDPHQPLLGSASAADLLQRVLENITIQSAHFAEMLTRVSWIEPRWFIAPVGVGMLCIVLGLLRAFARIPVTTLFISASLLITLLWPFDEGCRFLTPLFPLLLGLAFYGGAGLLGPLLTPPSRQSSGLASALSRREGSILTLSLLLSAISCAALVGTLLAARGGHSLGSQTIGNFVFLALVLIVSSLTAFSSKLRAALSELPVPARDWANRFGVLAICGLVVFGISRQVKLAADLHTGRPSAGLSRASKSGAATLSRPGLADGVLMAQTPEPLLHFLTGRKVITFPVTDDPQILAKVVSEQNVRWIFALKEGAFPYFRPTQQERVQVLRSRMSVEKSVDSTEFEIYEVRVAALPGK